MAPSSTPRATPTKLATSAPDTWHYPRPQLAQQYLKVFDIGLTSARGLFARRRMGKSEFLEQDLIPAAQAHGYRTAYLNLWDVRDAPTTALAAVLAQAMAPRGMAKLLKRLNTPLSKVKASGKLPGLGEASLEAELVDDRLSAAPLLSELLRNWERPKQPLLLVLDEAQVLAQAEHSNLAHSLRAGLDSRKHSIKVIFAGSSEPTLRHMFGRHSEPFYNWAPLEPFELLGDEFVRAMVAKVNDLTRYPLALADALLAFNELQRTPEFLRRYLNRYLTHAAQGSAAALEDTKAHVFNDHTFLATWRKLKPADQEMLKLIADGAQGLHSASTRLLLGSRLGVGQAVSANTTQHALRRLLDTSLVVKLDYGDYELLDQAFAEWVRTLELDDKG